MDDIFKQLCIDISPRTSTNYTSETVKDAKMVTEEAYEFVASYPSLREKMAIIKQDVVDREKLKAYERLLSGYNPFERADMYRKELKKQVPVSAQVVEKGSTVYYVYKDVIERVIERVI